MRETQLTDACRSGKAVSIVGCKRRGLWKVQQDASAKLELSLISREMSKMPAWLLVGVGSMGQTLCSLGPEEATCTALAPRRHFPPGGLSLQRTHPLAPVSLSQACRESQAFDSAYLP